VWQFLGVALAAFITGWFAVKVRKPEAASTLIENMQERQDKQDSRMDKLEATNRLLADYIGVLRQHIEAGSGPPAPVWPPELLNALNGGAAAERKP